MPEISQGDLLIGAGVVCKGTISVPDTAIIDGSVEGMLKAAAVDISRNGLVVGSVDAGEIRVSGMLLENAKVSGTLIVDRSGWVRGSIQYRALEVRKGGQLLGNIQMLETTSEGK